MVTLPLGGRKPMSASSHLIFDWLAAKDVADAYEIERLGYPTDEAASLQTLQYRQSVAKELFLGVYYVQSSSSSSRELIGFVCSTLSPSESLTSESMSQHVPGTSSVCIHSICIASSHRRQGTGLKLLEEYLTRLERQRTDGSAIHERVLLIAHEELRSFYEKAGFEWIGKSAVVHGSRPWYEMRKTLGDSAMSAPPPTALDGSFPFQTPAEAQQLLPRIWDVLQRMPKTRPTARLLSSFPNGMSDVIITSDPESTPLNKFDILCPRNGCGSIILKEGIGKWVERSSVQLEPPEHQPQSPLSTLPAPTEMASWWLVTPSPMTFENIGFSRPVDAQQLDPQAAAKKLKLLTCAECGIGPLGWCEENGSEFWLSCSRVGYLDA